MPFSRMDLTQLAHTHIGDVQEDAAGIVALHDLLHLRGQLVQIGRVVAHQVVVRLDEGIGLHAAGTHVEPFGMLQHLLLVQTGAEIHRRVHVDLPAGLKLRAQQVEMEVGMGDVGRGGMIGPAVMALGEDGDGIDVAQLQRLLKLRLVESAADLGNQPGGVEIQMHLTKSHVFFSFYAIFPFRSPPRRRFVRPPLSVPL